jgi:hypothetical protein
MKFGFELEFLSPIPRIQLARQMAGWERYKIDSSPVVGDDFWGVGFDTSLRAEVYHKVELRSPVFQCPLETSADRIIQMLRFLKRGGCGVNGSCGLHIHVSDETKEFDKQKLNIFMEENNDHLANLPNPIRQKYCRLEKYYLTHHNWVSCKQKYWLEFRIFNASLCARFVFKAVRDSLNYFNLLTVPVNRCCPITA